MRAEPGLRAKRKAVVTYAIPVHAQGMSRGPPVGLAGARAGPPRAVEGPQVSVFIADKAVFILIAASLVAAIVYFRSQKPATPGGVKGPGDLVGAVGTWAAVVAALGLLLSFTPGTESPPRDSRNPVSVTPGPER